MSSERGLKKDKEKTLRKEGGLYIRKLRSQAGLTQRELAEKLGIPYYTFISQIENGDGRLQSQYYEKAAAAFGLDPKLFVEQMLMFYDPFVHQVIFTSGKIPGQKK